MNKNETLEEIRKGWQPYYERELTLDDARNIRDKLTTFFRLLMEVEDRKINK